VGVCHAPRCARQATARRMAEATDEGAEQAEAEGLTHQRPG
jgi:hypothetical protein